MKVIIALFVLSGILLQTTAKLAILIDFKINQEYIAKNLCINKDVPDSCCKGSCHLKESLEEEEKSENPESISNLKDKFELLPFTLISKEDWFFTATIRKHHFFYMYKTYTTSLPSIFHPPNPLCV
jgi:hypothetical protein